MKKTVVLIYLLCFGLNCSCPFMGLINVFADVQELTPQTFKKDLAYYHKVSKKENFTSNDRLYLLLRIKDKYKESAVNISELEREISLVESEIKKPTPQPPPKVDVTTTETVTTVPSETVVPSQQEKYKIEIGDVLGINVSPADELSREAIVQPDGIINLTLIGNILAKGLFPEQLSRLIEKKLSEYVTDPKVSISIRYFSRRQVFIMGEVLHPGVRKYKENLRLFELVSLSGGFTDSAGKKDIKVHRGEPDKRKTITVDFEEILKSGDLSKDFILEPGDIVEIPKKPKRISIIGQVHSPGNYTYREGMKVLDAISTAGGPGTDAKLGSIRIFRETSTKRKVYKLNLNKVLSGRTELDIQLLPGDIILVPRKTVIAGTWFVSSVLPWLSLVALILAIRGGLGF